MEKKFFTVMQETNRVWVLNLEPETQKDAQRAISWQHTGGNYQPMHVCTFDRDTREFVSLEGRRFALPLERTIYTVKAWQSFMDRLGLDGRFSVVGSHGELTVSAITGDVLEYEPDSASDEYKDITRFNLDAIHNDGKPVKAGDTFDICDCGYWTRAGLYEEPLPVDWRDER